MTHQSSFILLTLFLTVSYAQQQSDTTVLNSLVSGSWSIQFGISSNFTLSNFKDTNIFLKRHNTPHKAWRFGITINGTIEDRDSDLSGFLSNSGVIDGDYDRINIQVHNEYLYYPDPNKKLNLFFGFGPSIGYFYDKTKEVSDHFRDDTLYAISVQNRESKSIFFRFSIIGGFEYFITKYISLHAEYNTSISFLKGWSDSSYNVNYTDNNRNLNFASSKDEFNRIALNSNSVLFGLSAYF